MEKEENRVNEMLDQFKTGNPIWVYYTNIDTGENLIVPQLLRGFVGQDYQVEQKDFDGYQFVESKGELSGTFDMNPHSVHLYYRNQDWGEVEAIEMYLHLDAPTPVYNEPNGMQVGLPYPTDLILKAFHRVATNTGEFWYEIGSDQWIKYDKMSVVSNPFDEKEEHLKSKLAENMSVLPTKDLHAVIDYLPGQVIDVFDEPYGQKVGELKDGEHITILDKLSDNGEVTWFRIGEKQFITGNYVKLEDEDDE
ncbi:MucBP domain-containing protein [Lactobacillaceae bacterium 24-114]